MKFKFFRKSQGEHLHEPLPASTEYKEGSLDQTMTDIAVQLINGQGGSEFRGYFINLFRHEPRFIKNVLPKYREALQQVLDNER